LTDLQHHAVPLIVSTLHVTLTRDTAWKSLSCEARHHRFANSPIKSSRSKASCTVALSLRECPSQRMKLRESEVAGSG
jgi:hypothetical protein